MAVSELLWLAPIPRKMWTIYHRFGGIFYWKRSCLGKSEIKKWRSRLFEDEIAEPLTWAEWKKCKNMQNTFLDWFYLLFVEYLRDITSVCILKPCREIGQSFEEGLRGGKRVKNWEIFWMNNKTIEFGCLTMWRIMQISVDNILLDLHNSTSYSAPFNNC